MGLRFRFLVAIALFWAPATVLASDIDVRQLTLAAPIASEGTFELGPIIRDDPTLTRSAYASVIVPGDFDAIHRVYERERERMEDEHYVPSRTECRGTSGTYKSCRYAFKLSVIPLFAIDEEHRKFENTPLFGDADVTFWRVKRTLDKSSKNALVGQNFRYLHNRIFFIRLGGNRTKIVYHATISSRDHGDLQAVKDTAREQVAQLLALVEAR